MRPPAPNAVIKVALSMAPGALRVGDVEQRHEDQRFRDHVGAVGEVLHADRVLVCAVRVASQPTSMKAPRIRNQLKPSMKLRDLVRRGRIRTTPARPE